MLPCLLVVLLIHGMPMGLLFVGDVDETCHGWYPVSTNNRNRMTTPPHVHATEKCDNSREQRHIICRQKTQGRRGTGGEEEEEEEEEE